MRHSDGAFWRRIMPVDWTYQTSRSIPECMDALIREEGTFGDNPMNLYSYRCVRSAGNRLELVFLGPRFGKARHTEYSLLLTGGNGFTLVDFHFRHELLGCPPFTSVQELDLFASEKIGGLRI